MRLMSLEARGYRSLLDASIPIGGVNVFIGANAAGKSTILDALRFLGEAVQLRDFKVPVHSRGRMIALAWKGAPAERVELSVHVADGDSTFKWTVQLTRNGYGFSVTESVHRTVDRSPPEVLLTAAGGKGEWWSGERQQTVPLSQDPTSCGLAAAAADASFPAHAVAKFIGRWGFFDPNPFLLRRDWSSVESPRLDHYGRNLAETLYRLDDDTRQDILEATQAIVGSPQDIEPRMAEDDDSYYFVQGEAGLQYRVHQMSVSSGTLRILALMTALHTSAEAKLTGEAKLIGIEEPENYVHPGALSSLVQHLGDIGENENMQLLVTTHSPLVLDALGDPQVVRVVSRHVERGTVVESGDAKAIRRALDGSGFGLGEYYQTRNFGN